jgi:hypothetical protein
MFNNFFFENLAVYEIMSKNTVEPEGSQMTSQCGARACTRPRTKAHARKRARTHTQMCNIYCSSTATMIRERASLLRYTCIAYLVAFILGTGEIV